MHLSAFLAVIYVVFKFTKGDLKEDYEKINAKRTL